VEAVSVGLPVIVSKDLTTKHMISNKNGYNFERGNDKQLASILDTLIRDDKMRKEMGKRSRELAEKELSWEVIAKKTIDIYSNSLRSDV
jgi:glycosyltransferase involved in cell wall biosynthesis